MSNKPKSDPPSFKLDIPFAKEIAALGFDAFDDPDEITSTTSQAIATIIKDQRANRGDNDSKTSLALLAVITKMRHEQKAASRMLKVVVFAVAVLGVGLFVLDKLGLIKFTLH